MLTVGIMNIAHSDHEMRCHKIVVKYLLIRPAEARTRGEDNVGIIGMRKTASDKNLINSSSCRSKQGILAEKIYRETPLRLYRLNIANHERDYQIWPGSLY